MPSQLKQLRKSRKEGNFNLIDKGIKIKIRRRKARNPSPTSEDMDRIIEDYMDEDFKRSVINKTTSIMAIESLERGFAIKGNSSDFQNFISSVGKTNMVDRVFRLFKDENIMNLLNQEIQLKTKTVRGFKFNNQIYLRETKAGLRAFTFKNNRFAKIPKNLFRN